ncbi:uncharacterized protein LOC34620374 [Cyclospora cayetanensis]|uniref:Uncharacterized protein LOC34620374 n=1 Tax=Cyclospora cayetanensis TaxID=88456 RepID=A0A6P6RUU4_9EIME|nr:uncharacterized protein LOC34620374 [Cyclospora cayetanensis]
MAAPASAAEADAADLAAAAENLIEDWEDAARSGQTEEYVQVLERAKKLAQQLEQKQLHEHQLPLTPAFKDARGNTALHYAAANGHVDLVSFLLSQGVDLEGNTSGNTALHWLVLTKQKELLQLLLREEAQQRSSCPLHRSAASDKRPDNEAEAAEAAAAEAEAEAEAAEAEAEAAEVAAKAIPAESCSCRLHVDVLRQNDFGKSALSEAFTAGDSDILQLLLEHHSAAQLEKDPLKPTGKAHMAAAEAPNGLSREKKLQQQEQQQEQGSVVGAAASAVVASSATHVLQFGNYSIRCREIALDWKGEVFSTVNNAWKDDTTGVALWASSLVGAQWLAHLAQQNPTLFADKAVLELGAGCGVLGLLCAAMQVSPASVTFTDVFPQTLENLRHNCRLNNLPIDQQLPAEAVVPTVASVLRLDWCDVSTWPKDETGDTKTFDIIVGSDLIYEASGVQFLVTAISSLLKPKTGRLYYIHRLSRDGASTIADSLRRAGLKVEELSPPDDYLQNCLSGKSNREFYMLFNELELETDFVLLRAAWR